MKSDKFLMILLMTLSALASFFIYFFVIDPSLHYHYQQIAWLNTRLFLNHYLAYSGGPAEYLSLFITQFFYSKLLGSLTLALIGFFISFFLFKTINLDLKKINLHILLIPAIQFIMLSLTMDYLFTLTVIFNLLIVMASLYFCSFFEKERFNNFPICNLIAGLLLYYVSGGMYFLIFTMSSLILLVRKSGYKAYVGILLLMLEAFIVPYLAFRFVFLTSLNNSYFRSTPDVATMLRYGRPVLFYVLLAYVPTTLFLLKLISLFSTKQIANDKKKVIERKGKIFSDILQLAVLVALAVALFYKNYNPVEKAKVQIDYYATAGEWDKVISETEKVKEYDRTVNFQYNRALVNTNQLLENLFSYSQLLGIQGLFLDKPFNSEVALPNSDIYFDLGNIDDSQRFAFESQTLMTNSPRVLKRLIINCLIMEKLDAANTYINVLSGNPMETKWVKKYKKLIDHPELAASDSLIALKRREMNKTEGMVGTPPLKLISQLEKNPRNKEAFEYLIAYDLMEHDLISLTEDFKFITQLDYKKLPRSLEEAVVLFKSQGKTTGVLDNLRISDVTLKRFREFAKLTSAAKGNRELAKQSTLEFKNTYWYYVLFLSPKVTNLKLETKPVNANY